MMCIRFSLSLGAEPLYLAPQSRACSVASSSIKFADAQIDFFVSDGVCMPGPGDDRPSRIPLVTGKRLDHAFNAWLDMRSDRRRPYWKRPLPKLPPPETTASNGLPPAIKS